MIPHMNKLPIQEPTKEQHQVLRGIRNPTVPLPTEKVNISNHDIFFMGWIKYKDMDILNCAHFTPTKLHLTASIDIWHTGITSDDIYLLESRGMQFQKDSIYTKIKISYLSEVGT